MSKEHKPKIKFLLCVSLLVTFIGPAIAGYCEYPRAAFFAALGGTLMTFMLFLELEIERFLKGFILIGAGVIYKLGYLKYLYIFVNPAYMPEDFTQFLEVLGEVMLLACSGAGGSIIAAHADRSSSDREKDKSHTIIIDNTKSIENLIEASSTLNRKLDIVITLSVILAALTLLVVAVTTLSN